VRSPTHCAVGRLLGAALAVGILGGVSGCAEDDEPTLVSYDVVPYTTASTLPPTSTTAPPTLQHTVVRGDSLYAIADRYCSTPVEIAALNEWSDGLDHVIYPGDEILVPGPGCPIVTDAVTTTTVEPNEYLARYLDEGVITDPFDPNAATQLDWGPVCFDAYWSAQAFATQGASRASLSTALDALPGVVPSEIIGQIALWDRFSLQWFPVYVAILDRIELQTPRYPDTDAFARALLADAEYLELLRAYESVGGEQFAARYWVEDVCDRLLVTSGSTP